MADERPRQKTANGIGHTIGGILVGFDEQVWRHQPPAQERVTEVDRLGTVVTPSGLTIELPDGGPSRDDDEGTSEPLGSATR